MRVWRALLRASAQQLPRSSHAAIDSTFFDRFHASRHYATRADRAVETLKATALVDTASQAVLDVQCTPRVPRNTWLRGSRPHLLRHRHDLDLQVDEKLRRDLPDGSARVKIFSAPGAYEVDWWSPEPCEDWQPVEQGEVNEVDEPDDMSHLA